MTWYRSDSTTLDHYLLSTITPFILLRPQKPHYLDGNDQSNEVNYKLFQNIIFSTKSDQNHRGSVFYS